MLWNKKNDWYTISGLLGQCRRIQRMLMGIGVSIRADVQIQVLQMEIGRVLSLLVAISCLIVAYLYGSSEIFHLGIVIVVLPLGCIWYGSEIGSFVDMSASEEGGADNFTGMLIIVAGWAALLIMLLIVVLNASGNLPVKPGL